MSANWPQAAHHSAAIGLRGESLSDLPEGVWGESSFVAEAVRACAIYAPVGIPVVLQGPIGTGKTLLAGYLHRLSKRNGPFVTVSVGELTDTLYADVLFGHERGAYTGAVGRRRGAFLRAAGGSLLLDDIAVMGSAAQAALLRAVESGEFTPLGGERDIPITCRMFYATTRPLCDLVRDGRILPDLASRVGELVIELPSLRQRSRDIPELAGVFTRRICREENLGHPPTVLPETLDALVAYSWPYNLRELRNVVERAVLHAVADGDRVIRCRHLPPRLLDTDARGPGREYPQLTPNAVMRVVREVGGNQSEAARRLGVHRNTVRKYLRS